MSAFDTTSREVLAEFLRTAVVIDDAAYKSQDDEKPVVKAVMPGRASAKKADELEPPARAQSSHDLDTRCIVDSFANMGLVCAVIAPQEEDDVAARLGRVAEHCDIVIADWQMFHDDGERTIALIKALCERDYGDRLRLLCVYSGEPEMAKISERLRGVTELKAVGGDDLLLRKDHIIVTILKKSVVPEDKIAGELVYRFSGFTKGLLSNAVLAALTGIRRNVHRVIRKFDAGLDPAYISHRIMSVPVDTVEGEVLSLIAAELESVVHQSAASSHIGIQAISEWMGAKPDGAIKYDNLKCEKGHGQELLEQLIKDGADYSREGISEAFKKASKLVLKENDFVGDSKLTELLDCNEPMNADRRFAMLSTLETRYEDIAPRLMLGTVIHDGNEYLLCLMPRCDSVRIPAEGREFLFVRLKSEPSSIDLIVEDDKEWIDLGVSKHPYDTVIYRLVPDAADKPVMARKKENGFWTFGARTHGGLTHRLRWVAELKPQIAQVFANEFATQVCRVGVAKSQWLHRLKKKEQTKEKAKKKA